MKLEGNGGASVKTIDGLRGKCFMEASAHLSRLRESAAHLQQCRSAGSPGARLRGNYSHTKNQVGQSGRSG